MSGDINPKQKGYKLVTDMEQKLARVQVQLGALTAEDMKFRIAIAKATATLSSSKIPTREELINSVTSIATIIKQIYQDLPTNRDWLDPALEAAMKDFAEKSKTYEESLKAV